MNNQCSAKVWRGSYHSSHCHRKPGYGPDGLYCRKHAEEYFPVVTGSAFVVRKSSFDIEEVPLVSRSTSRVTLLDSMASKRSQTRNLEDAYTKVCFSREEAQKYARELAELCLNRAEAEVQRYKEILARMP